MRPSWRAYFLDLADLVSTRATCPRLHCGAVLVRDHRILVTGYNGSLPDEPHCEDAGCDVEDEHCLRTIHAEANAIAQAALLGLSVAGATAYLTHSPCWLCTKLLLSAGVAAVIFARLYRYDDRVDEALARLRASGRSVSSELKELP